MSSRARAAAQWSAYPLVLAATIGVTLGAMARGLSAFVAMLLASLVGGALVIALERALPYRDAWARSRGDLRTDVCHIVFSAGAAQGLAALLFAAMGGARTWLSSSLGFALWPGRWPLWAQVLLALLLAELGYYWLHRAFHGTRLWRLHAVHHSAPRMYWLNSNRNHPLDILLAVLVMSGPLVLLGAGATVLALETGLAFAVMLLQHSNIDMRLGWTNAVFVGGEVHRWHHSRIPDEQSKNFGSVLMVWDVVFGTYFRPEDRQPPEDVGLTDMPAFPRGYLGQLASPLRAALFQRGAELDSPGGHRFPRGA